MYDLFVSYKWKGEGLSEDRIFYDIYYRLGKDEIVLDNIGFYTSQVRELTFNLLLNLGFNAYVSLLTSHVLLFRNQLRSKFNYLHILL